MSHFKPRPILFGVLNTWRKYVFCFLVFCGCSGSCSWLVQSNANTSIVVKGQRSVYYIQTPMPLKIYRKNSYVWRLGDTKHPPTSNFKPRRPILFGVLNTWRKYVLTNLIWRGEARRGRWGSLTLMAHRADDECFGLSVVWYSQGRARHP